MRFAKLEVTIITAHVVALFDFEPSDARGRPATAPPAPVHRNQVQAQRPAEPVYLRYRPREWQE